MNSFLDQDYENYKRSMGRSTQDRKVPNVTGAIGVPEPILEGEEDQEVSIKGCIHCGSMNISIDMSTNESTCNDCKKKSDKPQKINFQKQMEDLHEQEINERNIEMQKGTQYFMP